MSRQHKPFLHFRKKVNEDYTTAYMTGRRRDGKARDLGYDSWRHLEEMKARMSDHPRPVREVK